MAEPASRTSPDSKWGWEAWQVGAVRLPLWLAQADGRNARAWSVACFGGDQILASEVGTEEELPALLEKMLAKASRNWTAPPDRVELTGEWLADLTEPLLASHGVPVARVTEQPEVMRAVQRLLLERLTPDDSRPSPLTGEGVTLARLAAFARAAAAFYASPIWLHLGSADLVRIEAPEVEGDLREFYVDSGFGPRKTLPGLTFVLEDPDEDGGEWVVVIERPWDAPPDDLDLWERYGLPWAGEGGLCPVAWLEDEFPERPDRRRLAFFEGLLNALAATTEEELDSGRWVKEAGTADGPVRFVLSLPDLVETEPIEVEGETPEERAGELLRLARLLSGRRGIALARRAVAAWPGCAEAYLYLSEWSPGLEAAGRVVTQGMAAVRRELDLEAGGAAPLPVLLLGNRSANILGMLGRFEESVAAYGEVLDLAPEDPVAARYGFVNVLIALGRDAEAWELLDRFSEDSSALLAWPRALLSFRAEGDSPAARRWLKEAVQANRFAAGVLLGARLALRSEPPLLAGGEAEATLYSGLSAETWNNTPGALDWLRARVAPPPPSKGGKPRRLKKGKRRRR